MSKAEPSMPGEPGGAESSGSAAKAANNADGLAAELGPILGALNVAVVVLDMRGRLLLANPAAERLFQTGPQTGNDQPWHPTNIFLPDRMTPYPEDGVPSVAALRGETVQNVEVFVRGKKELSDGTRMLLSAIPIATGRGEQLGAVVTGIVIEAQNPELVEKEEKQAEKRFRRLLEAAPDAILEVDFHGHIVLINQTAEKMFGYSRDELMGLNVEALVPESMRAGHAKHRTSYAAHPQMRPMGTGLELHAQRKDGSLFPVEISLSPNPGEEGGRGIALVRDITARRQVEDRLKAIQEQYTAELSATNQQLEARNLDVERANRS